MRAFTFVFLFALLSLLASGVLCAEPTLDTESLPSDKNVTADSGFGTIVQWEPVNFNDNGTVVAGSCSPASGYEFPFGTTTTVNCTASNADGLNWGAFLVTVQNWDKPYKALPRLDATYVTDGPNGKVVSWPTPVSFNSVLDGNNFANATCAPASGSTFTIGTTTVACSAIDSNNQTGWYNFTIVIQADLIAPYVSTPTANVTANATSNAGAIVTFDSPIFNDTVSGTSTGTCTPASGSLFVQGRTIITCTTKDTSNNTGTFIFQVWVNTWQYPWATAPANITWASRGPAGRVVTWEAPVFTSNENGFWENAFWNSTVMTKTGTCSPASGSTFANAATTKVTCSAKDSMNMTGYWYFWVRILPDTESPYLLVGSPNKTVDATSSSGAVVSWNPVIFGDAAVGNITATCSPVSGSNFAADSTTTVTCSANDGSDNTASYSFQVSVGKWTRWTPYSYPTGCSSQAACEDEWTFCDFYTHYWFVNVTAENSYKFLKKIVETALSGNNDTTIGVVTDYTFQGILKSSMTKDHFNGNTVYRTNNSDDGLTLVKNSIKGTPDFNNDQPAAKLLVDHFVNFLASSDGGDCTAFRNKENTATYNFTYRGTTNLQSLHRNAKITKAVFDSFISAISSSMTLWGVHSFDSSSAAAWLQTYTIGAGKNSICSVYTTNTATSCAVRSTAATMKFTLSSNIDLDDLAVRATIVKQLCDAYLNGRNCARIEIYSVVAGSTILNAAIAPPSGGNDTVSASYVISQFQTDVREGRAPGSYLNLTVSVSSASSAQPMIMLIMAVCAIIAFVNKQF